MKTLPHSTISPVQIPAGSIATEKLTSQAADKHLVVPALALDGSVPFAVTFDTDIVVVAIITTNLVATPGAAGDVTVSILNVAAGISTVTIAQAAALYEIDNGTTPDVTHKFLTAGSPLVITSAGGAADRFASVHVIYHEDE